MATPDTETRGLVTHPFVSRQNALHLCLIAVCAFSLAHQLVKYKIESPFIDLGYLYFFSSMARQGQDLFNADAIEKTETTAPIRRAGGEAIYPPTMFVVLAPFTKLPFPVFATLWMVMGCMAVGFSLFLIIRSEQAITPLMVTAGCFIIAYCQPLHETFFAGQTDCMALLLATLAWFGFKRNRPWFAGFFIACMTVAKPHYIALVPALLLIRQWRLFGIAGLGTVVVNCLALPFLGIHHYASYVQAFAAYGSRESTNMFLGNIGFNGMAHRLFQMHPDHAFMAFLFFIAILGLPLLARLMRTKSTDPGIDFLICLCMVPVISPLTEIHHLTVLLLPLLVCIMRMPILSARDCIWYAAALVLIVSRYSWNRFAESSHAIFMPLLSMQVVGAYILAWTLVSLRGKMESAPPNSYIHSQRA